MQRRFAFRFSICETVLDDGVSLIVVKIPEVRHAQSPDFVL